jgi:hypothetical protein
MLPNNNSSNSSSGISDSSNSGISDSNSSSSINGNKRSAEIQRIKTKVDVNTEEADCPICFEAFGTKNIKTLETSIKDKKEVCGHSFHKDCIDTWINSTKQQEGGPTCPVCRNVISQDQWPQEDVRDLTIVQGAQAQIPDERARLIEVEEQQRDQQRQQGPVPFIGILVCLNGQPFQRKYLNSDFGLRTNNTLGDLKRQILGLAPEFAAQRTYFCQTNMGRNINNALSYFGVTEPRDPSFKIKSMYFGTPNRCDNFRELNIGIENMLTNDRPLIEIYKDYQRNISNALLHLNYSILHNIYNTHIVNDIGLRRGFRDTNYFVNFDNPEIPQEFRAEPGPQDGLSQRQYERSTRHSLAWLVVNIECNTLTRPINNNSGSVTNTSQQDPNQRPDGGGYAGGKMKTKNRHRHKKSVRKTSGKNKKSIRRRTKQHKKSVRKY